MAVIKICVTGDLTADFSVYQGERLRPDAPPVAGSMISCAPGGAGLLSTLLREMAEIYNSRATTTGKEQKASANDRTDPFLQITTPALDVPVERMPAHHNNYALYRPFVAHVEEKKKRVWRLQEALGYGRSSSDDVNPLPPGTEEDHDIYVIDDASLGFRQFMAHSKWPGCISSKNDHRTKWIILKMSSPVGQGDLWRTLVENHQEKLIIILSIDDLRCEEVQVSKGLSWERTAIDIMNELNHNNAIRPLLQCRHLIITFGSEGALHIDHSSKGQINAELIFDPEFMEGDSGIGIDGDIFGSMYCFTAAVTYNISLDHTSKNLTTAIENGLHSMRQLLMAGHGTVDADTQPGFPFNKIASEITSGKGNLAYVNISSLYQSADVVKEWTIAEVNHLLGNQIRRPLFGLAHCVALKGKRAFRNLPFARFGNFWTVDRQEIESLRCIRKLIYDYYGSAHEERPLNLAVFGPPGAGKSFAIKQIAEMTLKEIQILEFNLAQFNRHDELIGLFHQVRDHALQGKLPLVFWDEFDSRNNEWLQYFLAPMQDGKFQEGQITHPIGKCIFIFAGGTCSSMEQFSVQKGDKQFEEFKARKGPDFVSRLNGFLNVFGPNQRTIFDNNGKESPDPEDINFPIRRALLLRGLMKIQQDQNLDMDRGLLSAFLEVEHYKHGARSMEKIVQQLKLQGGSNPRRSHLPPATVMNLHVDTAKFYSIIARNLPYKLNDMDLSDDILKCFIEFKKSTHSDLQDAGVSAISPEETKADNRAAADRIPEILELVGLYIVSNHVVSKHEEGIERLIEQNIEILSEAEHDGWKEFRLRNGWKRGERDDENKRHPCLVPYAELAESDKEKDRNSVRNYPKILASAGYSIVTSLPD